MTAAQSRPVLAKWNGRITRAIYADANPPSVPLGAAMNSPQPPRDEREKTLALKDGQDLNE